VNLAGLLADPPLIHREDDGSPTVWGLLPEVLRFLEATVEAGHRTLETGSGLSTIVFAMQGAHHTCIVPNVAETERLLAYCRRVGVATDGLTFVTEPSERVLPGRELEALDLVLIDGSHSFPQAFIDWFYTSTALRVGGVVIVDDTYIWTGRVLRDFLLSEPEWELVEDWFGRAAAIRKTSSTDPDKVWTAQRYVAKRSLMGYRARARLAATMVRRGAFADLRALARRALSERRIR